MEDNTQQIQTWVAQARAAGLSDEQIAAQLRTTGWPEDHIDQLFGSAKPTTTPPALPMQDLVSLAKDAQHIHPLGNQPKGKNWIFRHLGISIGVLAGVLVLGGVTFAGLRGFIPLPFIKKDIQTTLDKAIQVLADAKSGEIGLTIQVAVEPRDGNAKTYPEATAGTMSAAEARSVDSDSASNAGQLRTGLALYYDTYNTFPEKLEELVNEENRFISKLPSQPAGYEINYAPNQDRSSYILTYSCASDKTKQGKIDYKDGIATTCTTGNSDSGIFDIAESFDVMKMIPSDMQLHGSIVTFIGNEAKDKEKPNQGYVILTGSYSSGGTTINVDGEVRMKDKKVYAIVRQFPSLFFIDLTALKEKWIVFDPTGEDANFDSLPIDDLSEAAPSDTELQSVRAEFSSFVKAALQAKAINAANDGSETLNGRKLQKIKITLDPSKLPAAITAYREDTKKRGTDPKEFLDALEEVAKPENLTKLQVLADQSSLTVWMEMVNSTPHKIELTTIVVPSDEVEKFKGKQLRLQLGLTLEHLGDQPSVSIPGNTISVDEAERLLTGVSEAEQKFSKQRSAVTDLRSALLSYKNQNGNYPETLAALLENAKTNNQTTTSGLTIENVGGSNTNTAKNYFGSYSSRTSIPKDRFTGKDIPYQKTASGYSFTYTMQLPPEQTDDNAFDSYSSSSYYRDQFVEGTNTATEVSISKEAQAKKDTALGLTAADRILAQQFVDQKNAVQGLRSALTTYFSAKKTYPTKLSELLEKREGSGTSSYLHAVIIPNDVFTGKPFTYSATATTYTLGYTMHLPKKPITSTTSDLPYISASDLTKYVEGKNTANPTVLSQEVNEKSIANIPTVNGVNVDGYVLLYPPSRNSGNTANALEYTYRVANPQRVSIGASVGMRIASNPQKLTAEQWYQQTFGEVANGTEEKVDGNVALRTGRKVVVAVDWKNTFSNSTQAEPYIFYLSYTESADPKVKEVFDAFLQTLHFSNLPVPKNSANS